MWIIWQFSANPHAATSPLVRPPLLGGNEKVGVFASRSPFRPNAMGLSSVRLSRVDYTAEGGPLLYVRGADLMDGTPIFDIKPYVSLSDCHPEARCGFVDSHAIRRLSVTVPSCQEAVHRRTVAGACESARTRPASALPQRSVEDIRNALCRAGCEIPCRRR